MHLLSMLLGIVLTLAALACAQFDITFPQGVVREQASSCDYKPNGPLYLWNPKGSPLAWNQTSDKTQVILTYCDAGSPACVHVSLFIQPYAGRVCISNLASEQFGPVGTNGTLLILIRDSTKTVKMCLPILMSDDGPLWDPSKCVADANTGFQKSPYDYEEVFGDTLDDILSANGVSGRLDASYVTNTVVNGMTSDVYDFILLGSGTTTTLNISTITPISLHDQLLSALTLTVDGNTMLYNVSLPVPTTATDWTLPDNGVYSYSSSKAIGPRVAVSGFLVSAGAFAVGFLL